MSLEPLAVLAELLRDLSFMVYGGSMIAFTALIAGATRLPGLAPTTAVRAYRAWGPGLGISLGLTVLSALAAHWLRIGAWSWAPGDGLGWLGLLAWLAFFGAWVSNIVLEVWTLEPLRKLDPPEGIRDTTAWNDARVRLEQHLLLQSLFVGLTALLGKLAQGAG